MKTSARATLDRDIGGLTDGLMRMGSLVDDAIDQAMKSLAQRDTRLAHQIVDGDAHINDLRFAIEEQCLTLIATQQPAAGDLRSVMAAFSIVSACSRSLLIQVPLVLRRSRR